MKLELFNFHVVKLRAGSWNGVGEWGDMYCNTGWCPNELLQQ